MRSAVNDCFCASKTERERPPMCSWSRDEPFTCARLIALAACLSCAPAGAPHAPASEAAPTTPSWAMHVPAPSVDRSASLAGLEALLIEELASGAYVPEQLPPEQVAALAIDELREAHYI